MPLCKPQARPDGEICQLCGWCCEKQNAEKVTCPYETEFMDSNPVLVIGIVFMGVAVVGLLVLAVLAWMGKL